MRRLTLVLFLSVTSIATPALAASPDPVAGPAPTSGVRSQFYIFDGSSFEAGAKVPGMELMNPRSAARFGRLVSLKKDLLAGISHSRRDRSLK